MVNINMSLIRDLIKRRGGGGKTWEEETAANMALEQCLDCIKEYFDCSICRDALQRPIQTQCGHVFCGKCLNDLCMLPSPSCPLCKKPISNRSLIARDDVGDMAELVSKLNKVFTLELEKFFHPKKTNSISVSRSSFVSTCKVTSKVTELEEEADKEQSRCEKVVTRAFEKNKKGKDKVVEPEKTNTVKSFDETIIAVKNTPEKVKRSSGVSKEVDVQIGNESLDEQFTATTRNRALKKNPDRAIFEEKNANEAPLEPKGTSTSQKWNQMMNQEYAIMTADVIPERPMDLSLSRRKSPSNIKYKFKKAIKYVKPLDLSMKKDKRKLDEAEENFNDDDYPLQTTSTTIPEQVASPPHDQHKKGKFEDDLSVDSFVFKPPSKSVSQMSKKKSKDEQEKNDDEYMEIDIDDGDGFQQPTDSDLLFLDLSMSTAGGRKNDDGKRLGLGTPSSNLEVNRLGNRRAPSSGSGSDSEKENGTSTHFLSGRKKRKASPVKSAKPSTSELNQEALIIDDEIKHDEKKSKSQNYREVDMFEDEEDEDWLLDIPESTGSNKSSGKPKQDFQYQKFNPTVQDVAVDPVTTTMTRQRYVFCPTRLSKSQTLKLQALCEMCNGTITKEFTQDVTHLVINLEYGRVPQTLKYLLAIAGRKWVVIYDWIEKCVDRGEIVSEGPYETSNFKQCDPGVKRSRLSKKNLFDGVKFYFATEIYKSLGFTKNEVTTLLTTLGATVVDAAENRYRDLIIIGSLNGDSTEYNDWLNTKKWITVTFDWVIECILEYRMKPFEQKHLCVDASKVKSINAPKSFQTAFSQYLTQKSLTMSPLSC